MPAKPPAPYTDDVIRAALTSLTTRPHVPAEEQLTMVPFKVGDTAGMRLVRVVPGVAVQFTDGPKDAVEATEQPHLVIAAAPGGPAETPRPRSVRPQCDERLAAVQGPAHRQLGADAHRRPART